MPPQSARSGERRRRAKPTSAPTQFLGYVRVSTDEQGQSGLGMEAQQDAIRIEVDRRGWDLLEIIEDAGYSAKNLKRPGIARALEILERGEADGLVVSKLDRLSRSIVDFAGLMDRSQREGWALRALDLDVDTTTPQGEAMANMMATFAQFERRLIGQRTKAALAVKKSQGVRLGRRPLLDPAVRRRIRSMVANGATYTAIAEQLNVEGVSTAQGGRRWYPATVRSCALVDVDLEAP